MQKQKRSIPKIINAVFASLLIVAALFLCVSVLVSCRSSSGMLCGALGFFVLLAILLILWAILTILLYKCPSYTRLWSYTLSATGVITLIMSASALYQATHIKEDGLQGLVTIMAGIFGYLALIVGIPLLLAGITLFLIEKFK